MKKVFFILALLVVLSSCSNETVYTHQNYVGTEGVVFDFSSNMPPSVLYENTPAIVSFDVFNRGAYSIRDPEKGIITLRYDNLYFSSDRRSVYFEGDRVNINGFTLEGRQPGYPRGDRTLVELGRLDINEIQGDRSAVTTRLSASICYPYKTFLTETVCVDTDVFEGVSDPVCRSRGAYTYSSQGAPIAISKIEPRMIPRSRQEEAQDVHTSVVDPETGQFLGIAEISEGTELFIIQPVFEIEVRNAGRGTVFYSSSSDTHDVCTGMGSARELNQVKISAMLGSQEMDCSPEIVTLRNDRGTTICRVPDSDLVPTIGSYTQIINVEAEYYYSDFITKDVEIRKLN